MTSEHSISVWPTPSATSTDSTRPNKAGGATIRDLIPGMSKTEFEQREHHSCSQQEFPVSQPPALGNSIVPQVAARVIAAMVKCDHIGDANEMVRGSIE